MQARKNIAIVLAAGQGKRMGTEILKQFMDICGYPLLYYSLKCFQDCPDIDEIILMSTEREVSYCKTEIVEKYNFSKVSKIVVGGKERYNSVYEGLKQCEDCAYVFIHDASRPFINQGILARTLAAAKEYRGCVAAMPAKDTVKISDAHGFIEKTPSRSSVWIVQTPQVFEYQLVRQAYDDIMVSDCTDEITDDAMVVEAMTRCPVRLVEGTYKNIKVTTPEDLEIAEIFIRNGF